MFTERNETLDSIKFLAIFGVVAIHTGTFKHLPKGEYLDFAIDALARFGVAYFFAVSGFLLMNKVTQSKKPNDYFKHYIMKLFKILLAWSAFYFVYDLVRLYILAEEKSISIITTEWASYITDIIALRTLYYGTDYTHYHLWYLFALIWSIVILCFFIRFRLTKFLLIVSFTFYLIGLFGQSYSHIYTFEMDTRDALFFGLFFVTLGAFVSKYKWKFGMLSNRVNSFSLVILILIVAMLQLIEAYINVYVYGGNVGNYYLSTVLLTFLLLLLSIKHKKLGEGTWVNSTGKNTLGIYVTHPFYISLFNVIIDLCGLGAIKESVWWGLGFTPIVFILSHYSYLGIQTIKAKFDKKRKDYYHIPSPKKRTL
ncbi:acyltransferase [Halobacillus hunanensis]|uniref:acyltransferase n=1 Tax=Halobacillus hunanensis TaxID=578214 RepID=UPI0015902DFD|nr:acyltransferase [Halobacillus hunanensis]